MDVGANLKKARENSGLTQVQVAKEMGCVQKAICNHESGLNLPSTKNAYKYCEIFELGLVDLFGEDVAVRYEYIRFSREYEGMINRKQRLSDEVLRMRLDREAAGLTFEEMNSEISKSFGFDGTASLWCCLELGKNQIKYEHAVAYAHVLGTDSRRYFEERRSEGRLWRSNEPEGDYNPSLGLEELGELIVKRVGSLGEKTKQVILAKVNGERIYEIAEREGVGQHKVANVLAFFRTTRACERLKEEITREFGYEFNGED